jgi:diguanylate cyclase
VDEPGGHAAIAAPLDGGRDQGDRGDGALDALFERYFGAGIGERDVSDAAARVASTIDDVHSLIREAGSGAARYGERLAGFAGDIDGKSAPEEVAPLVRGILVETRRLLERNRTLEGRLGIYSKEVAALKRNHARVREQALTDGLTGLANRKCFDARLAEAIRDAAESGAPLALLMIDIDLFKRFNDTYGHLLGDEVLKLVARTLTDGVKGRDLPARYGGEEFAVILPHTTLADAVTLSDQLRCSVAAKQIIKLANRESLGGITFSVGVALYRPGEPAAAFIARADAALYAAKAGGRNRVTAEDALAA